MTFRPEERKKVIPRVNPIITTILTFVLTFVLALFIWWLFGDPDGELFIWKTFRLYRIEGTGNLFLNYIFLFVLSVILYIRFIDPEMKFKEYLMTQIGIKEKEVGLILFLLNVALMFAIAEYIILVWGEISSLFNQVYDFAFFLIPSIGIFIYLFWSFFGEHWPLEGLDSNIIRSLQFLWCSFLLVLIYAWFALPAQANGEFKQVMSLNAFIGYLYSAIAVMLLLGMLWDNWPIQKIKNQPYRGILAMLICLIGGYVFYILLTLASTQSWFLWENPGGDWYLRNAANFSIFLISWTYFWTVYCYNWPNEYSMKFNVFMRTLLVLILAALNYYVYYIYLGDFLNESIHFYNKLPFAFVGLWFAILMVYDKFFERVGLWKKPLG
ncbi:MAG: hypothetical protein ACFFCD_06340 [Promethearchaeota archaeon]